MILNENNFYKHMFFRFFLLLYLEMLLMDFSVQREQCHLENGNLLELNS